MGKKKISKAFSFLGWSFKIWAAKNKVEVLKVLAVILGALLVLAQGTPIWFVALMGLILKFIFDSVHYFLKEIEI